MYADRYGPRQVNRGSLSLSVGIVGALVAAAMLSPTVIRIVERDPSLTIYAVPPPVTPPPPDKPVEQSQQRARPTRIAPPDPIVPTPAIDAFPVARLDPVTVPELPSTEDTGGGVVVDPPRLPAPVLTGATPDPRVDFQPTYPAEERRAGNEGVVRLRVLIGVDGRVRQVERIDAPSEAFWRVTQDRALAKWRFRPATRDGVPYEVWRTMTVRFRLEAE